MNVIQNKGGITLNNIKKIRQSKHVTQEDLAAKIGLTSSAVAKWETGKSDPRVSMLPEIAKVLDCTVAELLNEGEPDADAPASA